MRGAPTKMLEHIGGLATRLWRPRLPATPPLAWYAILQIEWSEKARGKRPPTNDLSISGRTHPPLARPQVARRGERPEFPRDLSWPGGPSATRMVKDVIEACWAADPKARLSAYQVMERLDDIKAKVGHPARRRGRSFGSLFVEPPCRV